MYARIAAGFVAELFAPPDGVPIEDCFHPDIAAQFVPVPDVVSPGQNWTYDGEAFAAPPAPPPPTLQQKAMTLLDQPLTVQCTSTSALDGAYPIDQTTQMQITGIAAAISAGLGLPSGGATFNWPDAGGVAHPWPAAQFTEYAKAVMNFVYACAQVAQGHGTTLPPSTIVIA